MNVYTFTVEMIPTKKQRVSIENQMKIASTIQNIAKQELYARYVQYNRRKDVRFMLKVLNKTKDSQSLSVKGRRNQVSRDLQTIRKNFGLTEHASHKYIASLPDSVKHNLHSHILQKLASRAWQAVEKLIYHSGHKLRYFDKGEFTSLEGKTNRTGYRIKKEALCTPFGSVELAWKQDLYTKEVKENVRNETNKIQFTRIIRKEIRGKVRFYCQIILKGNPPIKRRKDGSLRHQMGRSKMGIDVGVTCIAVSSPLLLRYFPLGETDNRNILTDRKRKSGKREKRKSDKARVQKERRRECHQKLINKLMSHANLIYIEEMNFQSIKKRKEKGEISFGKTIDKHAPALFVELLEKKLNYSGGTLCRVNTHRFCASQWDHTNNEKVKTCLSKREKTLSDGTIVLRDAYSAFLLEQADDTLNQADKVLCDLHFERFKRYQMKEILRLQQSDREIRASGVKSTNKKARKC